MLLKHFLMYCRLWAHAPAASVVAAEAARLGAPAAIDFWRLEALNKKAALAQHVRARASHFDERASDPATLDSEIQNKPKVLEASFIPPR